jgi:hypothetical protein
MAMWGTIGILVVAVAVFGVRRADGDPTAETVAPPIPAISALDAPSIEPVEAATTSATARTSAGPTEQRTTTTMARSGLAVLSAMSDLIDSGVPEPSTTTSPPLSATEGGSTTPPTTTTTPPTTTTTPPTTTTTPPTTTTTVPAPGLFVIGFDGQAKGDDDDDWSVLLSVNLGATVSGTWRAQVYVSWSGAGGGRTVLETGGSGKASAVVGPFDGDSVAFTIEDIRSSEWLYLPGLNRAATRLTVAAPTD